MLPKKLSEENKKPVIHSVSNSIYLQEIAPKILENCLICQYNFQKKKNSIQYNKYVIRYKKETTYHIVCSKCISEILDEDLEESMTYEEFKCKGNK